MPWWLSPCHAPRLLRSVEGSGGGLENALPWCGSKQERHPRIRSARRGNPVLIEEDIVFIIGIDPHKGKGVLDGQTLTYELYEFR